MRFINVKYSLISLWVFLTTQAVLGQGNLEMRSLSEHAIHVSAGDQTSVKALILTDDHETVLVDALFGELAVELANYLSDENLRVKYLVNTHYHGDHTGGNQYFKDADIIGHENTHQLLADAAPYGPTDFEMEDYPNVLFQTKMTIKMNGNDIHLYHFGSSHTAGDIVVHFPKDNLIHVGDIMLDGGFTLPFANDPEGLMQVLDQIEELINDETMIITGHGGISNRQELHSLKSILELTLDHVRSGGTSTQYPESWNQWDSDFLTMENWLKLLERKVNH